MVKTAVRLFEWSANNAWKLNLNDGNLNNNNKKNTYRVRPVCEYVNGKKSVIIIMVKYDDVFEAYYNCLKNKRKSAGAVKYFQGFEEDLIKLTDEINSRQYKPSISTAFIVREPVRREIFAACFRDRIIHHYIIIRLEPLFEKFFTERTFNCRKEKGVLYGLEMLKNDLRIRPSSATC